MTAKKTSKKTTKKTTSKKRSTARAARPDVGAQLEQAFLAGLGALSNAKDVGNKAFDTLVDQGLTYRKKATKKTEALIDNVQDAIRDMTDDAQSRASGLMGQMRETPQLAKLQTVFDARVADALGRIGVASKNDIDDINKKLDTVLKSLSAEKKAAKAPAKRKTTAKKATKKKVAKKPAAKKKAAPKKAAPKKVSKKKVAAKPAAKKAAKPAAKKVAKAAPKAVAKPAPKAVAKPAPKAVANPAPKAVAKPAPKAVAKPEPKPVTEAAPKPAKAS